MQTDQVSPTPPPTQPVLVREAPRSFWASLWPEVIIGSVVVGLALFGASLYSENSRAKKADQIEQERALQTERLENLRFVRDIATQPDRNGAFRGIDLEGMNLSGLDFPCRKEVPNKEVECGEKSADFTDAHLSGANMTLMDLRGANFVAADLSGADLRYSDLSGTNFDKANLDGALLGSICQSDGTVWPDDDEFTRPRRQEAPCGPSLAGNISLKERDSAAV